MRSSVRRLIGILLVGLAPVAAAAPCASDTLANYLALGSCEIGTTAFSGFASLPTLPAGSTPIASSAITVVPLVSPGNPGFTFVLNAVAGAGEVLSILIQFQAMAAAFTGASAAIGGAGIGGDGVALNIEDLCIDGTFANPPSDCGGTPATLLAFADANGSQLLDSITFGPATLLDVVVNFIIDGGLTGSASLESGTVQFVTGANGIPEPSTLALVLLAALLLARRRSTVHA